MFNKEKTVELIVDKETCKLCGICIQRCPGKYLYIENEEIKTTDEGFIGCLQCGNCMMFCPNDSIKIRGEGISENDIFSLPPGAPTYEQLMSLFYKRRSFREFKKQEIPEETITKLLDAGTTAPIGVPPMELKALVINGTNKVQELARDIVDALEKMCKQFSNPLMLTLFKPVIGKNFKMFKEFVLPLANTTVEARKAGVDVLFYNAPLVIVLYGPDYMNEADASLAFAHIELAAETLGIGTCLIGTVPHVLEKNEKLKEKYGIAKDEKPQMAMILGYPTAKYNKGIKRHYKTINYR